MQAGVPTAPPTVLFLCCVCLTTPHAMSTRVVTSALVPLLSTWTVTVGLNALHKEVGGPQSVEKVTGTNLLLTVVLPGEEFDALYAKYEQEGRGRKTIKAQKLWYAILEA
jgi:hypothetical protein